MNIYGKLTALQAELKAPKGQYNSFGKYSYRSCEDILEAVKPLLVKHKLSLIISDEIVEIGGRIYVKATATVTGEPSDGTPIVVTAYAREEESKKGMDGSQVTGASSSYARKYALNGLFLIDDNKDADTDQYHQQTTKTPKYLCESCGSLIKPVGTTSAETIAKGSKERCGKYLCAGCYQKAKTGGAQ